MMLFYLRCDTGMMHVLLEHTRASYMFTIAVQVLSLTVAKCVYSVHHHFLPQLWSSMHGVLQVHIKQSKQSVGLRGSWYTVVRMM